VSIEWKDSYKVGNAEIDVQHQELFKRINRFFESQDKATLTGCAINLYQYTLAHFGDEEDVMRRLDYPGANVHSRQHRELIARLSGLSKHIADETLDLRFLKSYLADWLLKHISVYDAKLAKYANFQDSR
jgi:hemerythrin